VQGSVAEELAKLVPVLQDVNARPHPRGGGKHRLVFQDRWADSIWYEPHEVSDGTILTLAYLLLPHQEPPLDLVGIEEPERGLHPYLLGEIVGLLRKLSRGELGSKPVQVVLATH
jgi:predicted ATPase